MPYPEGWCVPTRDLLTEDNPKTPWRERCGVFGIPASVSLGTRCISDANRVGSVTIGDSSWPEVVG